MEYIKAVDYLNISRDQKAATLLQKQVTELTEKSEQENYAILGKLTEKEKETEQIKKQMEELRKNQEEMIQSARKMQKLEDWLNEFNTKDPYSHIASWIWTYLDPGGYGNYNPDFPELMEIAKRLQELRLEQPCQKCGQPMKNGLPIKEQNEKNNNNNREANKTPKNKQRNGGEEDDVQINYKKFYEWRKAVDKKWEKLKVQVMEKRRQ